MAFFESMLAFLAGFLKWFWPVLVLWILDSADLYGRFLRERVSPSQRKRLDSVFRNRMAKGVFAVVTALLAASAAYHPLRMEKEADGARLVRLEAELFRVGVVYSERLQHVSDTTWKAQNEIGKIIGLSIDGAPLDLTSELLETQADRITIRGEDAKDNSTVELVYMARHTVRP